MYFCKKKITAQKRRTLINDKIHIIQHYYNLAQNENSYMYIKINNGINKKITDTVQSFRVNKEKRIS